MVLAEDQWDAKMMDGHTQVLMQAYIKWEHYHLTLIQIAMQAFMVAIIKKTDKYKIQTHLENQCHLQDLILMIIQ